MHSFIITGGTKQMREDYCSKEIKRLKVLSFDIVAIEGDLPHIGIAEVRDFGHRLLFKPNESPYTIGVIKNAERLTMEAQNALLKTLEEPPPHAQIYIIVANSSLLLPTIVSRCQVISVGEGSEYSHKELAACAKTIEKILGASVGQRLMLIEDIAKNRDDALAFLDVAIPTLRQSMLSGNSSSHQATALIRNILRARGELSLNANPKLVIDTIFLASPLDKPISIV